MKSFFVVILFSLMGSYAYSQDSAIKVIAPDPAKKLIVTEASCGMCKFGMKGDDCALAVRLNGKSYYVDGTDINDHGDAHATDGFCNAIRKAKVQGQVVDGRFKASYFKLVTAGTNKKVKKKKTTGG
jgi:Family of unknown function (DUF6370)